MPDTARCAARFAAGHSLLWGMSHRRSPATGDDGGDLFLAHPVERRSDDGGFIRTRSSHDAPNLVVYATVSADDNVLVAPVFVAQNSPPIETKKPANQYIGTDHRPIKALFQSKFCITLCYNRF